MLVAAGVILLLIALTALYVAAEFAAVGARRSRSGGLLARNTRALRAVPIRPVLPLTPEKAQYLITRLGHGNTECRSLSVPEPFRR